jgi:cell wall-associated NlpC family hydrolase
VRAVAAVTAGALVAGAVLGITLPDRRSPVAHHPRPEALVTMGFRPHPAWVTASVATLWLRPGLARRVDRPELARPGGVVAWLARMTVGDRWGLNGRVATQVLLGRRVVVLRRSAGWAEVQVPDQTGRRYPQGVTGWVPYRQVSTDRPPDTRWQALVIAPRSRLYAWSGRPELPVSFGTVLPARRRVGRWLVVWAPGQGDRLLAANSVRLLPTGAAPPRATGMAVAAMAWRFIGLPYLWAGTSGFGFDCSGFTYSLFQAAGVRLARDAADQARQGRPVRLGQLRPGDLTFFGPRSGIDHVAVYVGDGLLVQSPHTGARLGTISLRLMLPALKAIRRMLPPTALRPRTP